MQCQQIISQLDAYLDATLAPASREQVSDHLGICADCRQRLQQEEQWRKLLLTLPVPAPAEGFAERVLANVKRNSNHVVTRPWWRTPMLSSALAASLVLGVMIGIWLPSPQQEPAGMMPMQVVTTEIQTVRLAFNAGQSLQDVTLTLELPAHVELAAFPGERSISWKVDLEPGQNMLALPLRVLMPNAGELIAHLDNGTQSKTFRVTL